MASPKKRCGPTPLLVVIPTLVAAALLAGCDDPDRPVNRDRYVSLDECMADWGDAALCQQPTTLASNAPGGQPTGSGSSVVMLHSGGGYYGPSYYDNQRHFTRSDGSRLTPAVTSTSPPVVRAPASQFAGSPGVTARSGGFGATGRAVSSAGSSAS